MTAIKELSQEVLMAVGIMTKQEIHTITNKIGKLPARRILMGLMLISLMVMAEDIGFGRTIASLPNEIIRR
jgi:hypothetical protein